MNIISVSWKDENSKFFSQELGQCESLADAKSICEDIASAVERCDKTCTSMVTIENESGIMLRRRNIKEGTRNAPKSPIIRDTIRLVTSLPETNIDESSTYFIFNKEKDTYTKYAYEGEWKTLGEEDHSTVINMLM